MSSEEYLDLYLKCQNNKDAKYCVFIFDLVGYQKLNYKKQPICFKPALSSSSRCLRIIDNIISEYKLLLEKPNSAYISYKKAYDFLKQQQVFPKFLVMEYLPQ